MSGESIRTTTPLLAERETVEDRPPPLPPVEPGWRATLFRYIPALDALRRYNWRDLGADTVAGVTVAAVAVPQAMAYALIVGLHPSYGLYTAIVMTFFGALLDSSRQLINGPTNAISIALLSALAYIPPQDHVAAVIVLAGMVGVIQTGITLLRLGDLTRFVSHGVIVGFTVGAGLLLVLDQLKNLVGLRAQGGAHDHFLVRFWLTLSQGEVHGWTMAIGLGTIALVLLLRWLRSRVEVRLRFPLPELLLAVIVASLVVWWLGLDQAGVSVVGDIPQRLPHFQVPDVTWARLRELSGSALAIAVLGLLEAIAMAKAIAARTGQKLDINQQCLSEGVANLVGSFFQCMPGSGSLTRSAINQQAGAVSQWSGVIAALIVALTVLLLAPLAYYIPKAALAGILIVTAWHMVDRTKLLYHLRTTRFDAGIVIATAVAALAISVEFCILIGVFLSFTLYVPRAARLIVSELTVTPERVLRERSPSDPPCGRILIYNIEGELFFGSAPELERELEAIRRRCQDGIRVVVLRLKRARNPDAVCLAEFDKFIRDLQARKITVLLCGVRADMLQVLQSSGLAELLGSSHIFSETTVGLSSTLDAVRHAYDLLAGDLCDTCPRRQLTPDSKEAWYYMI